MATRLPAAVATVVRDIADERDWSYSDTLAALVSIGLAHLDDLPRASNPQQELPLTKAS